MSKPKFTPGPWEAHRTGAVRKCDKKLDCCCLIAEMTPTYRLNVGIIRNGQEQWANTRLIAAAPELFDSLTKLVKIAGKIRPKWPVSKERALLEAVLEAHEVLAKARGVESDVPA